MTTRNQAASAADLYHPIEQAILADYLGVKRPKAARGINIQEDDLVEQADVGADAVHLRSDYWGNVGRFALANAVARLVLNSIQYRLPQWAISYGNGNYREAREYNSRRKQGVTVLPQYLFMINWADSGPGFSWPEKYFVAYMPGFDRYVVTASADCPDCYGYEDIAVGSFDPRIPVEEGSEKVLVDWWQKWTNGDPERRWQCFWDPGLIQEFTARRWARLAWGPDDNDLTEADNALGMLDQNFSGSRDDLIAYAVENDYVWGLEWFLDHRGWLDDDWEERLSALEEAQP